MQLSAIIPTHNRPDQLRRCLESLRQQDVDSSALEVVVVDDGSTEAIEPIVLQAAAGGVIPMRCERQDLAGLNAARNQGASVSTGPLLAFLDDDTVISPGWARALITAFEDPACSAVGGRVELELAAPAPPWLAGRRQYLAEYDLGPDPRWLKSETTGHGGEGGDPLPVGANCAVRRSVFDRVGGFRQGLDRIGDSLVSNGDTDSFRRPRARGGALRHEPSAQVIHCVPAERLTVDYFIRRQHAQGVSDELLLAQDGQRLGGASPSGAGADAGGDRRAASR